MTTTEECAQCAYDREHKGLTIHYHPAKEVDRWADRRFPDGSPDLGLCPLCDGSGLWQSRTCQTCGGNGRS